MHFPWQLASGDFGGIRAGRVFSPHTREITIITKKAAQKCIFLQFRARNLSELISKKGAIGFGAGGAKYAVFWGVGYDKAGKLPR